jgi:DNA-binding NarL/FixJ family response regulator
LQWLFDKKCAGENIVEAIHAVSRGEEYFAKRFEKKYLIHYKDNSKLIKNITTAHPILTDRELKSLN